MLISSFLGSFTHAVLQIKNAVITAQSIALAEKDPFSMAHIKRLLDVQEEFDNDMRGGSGYKGLYN